MAIPVTCPGCKKTLTKVVRLKLTLPGMQIGQKGPVRFMIPVTMIERK